MGTDGIWSEGRDTRVGDEAHVVPGCPVPLVLRKLSGSKHDCACATAKVSPGRPQTFDSNSAAGNSELNSSVVFSSLQPKVPEGDTTLSTGVATETDHDGDEEKSCYHAPLCDCHHIHQTDKQVYQLIGTCYVDKIMDEEAVESLGVEARNIFLRSVWKPDVFIRYMTTKTLDKSLPLFTVSQSR